MRFAAEALAAELAAPTAGARAGACLDEGALAGGGAITWALPLAPALLLLLLTLLLLEASARCLVE